MAMAWRMSRPPRTRRSTTESRLPESESKSSIIGWKRSAPADPKRRALELRIVWVAIAAEIGMHVSRASAPGLIAQLAVVGGNRAPLADRQVLFDRGLLDRLAWVVPPHEQDRYAMSVAEDRGRDGNEHAGAVGGLGVRRERAAVLDARQPVEGGIEDGARRVASGVGDEADAARVTFTARIGAHVTSKGRGRIGGCQGRFLAEGGAVACAPTWRDYPKPPALHACQRVIATARTGPGGGCSRYCAYLALSSASAWSRSLPASMTRASPLA